MELHLLFEYLRVILERGLGPAFGGLRLPDNLDRLLRAAAFVTLEVHLAIAPHLHLAPFRERIDRADAHAVQSAGYLVAAAAELAACMQDGHHHLQRRFLHGGVHPHRDAASVIGNAHA